MSSRVSVREVIQIITRLRSPEPFTHSDVVRFCEIFWPVSTEDNLAYPHFHQHFRGKTKVRKKTKVRRAA